MIVRASAIPSASFCRKRPRCRSSSRAATPFDLVDMGRSALPENEADRQPARTGARRPSRSSQPTSCPGGDDLKRELQDFRVLPGLRGRIQPEGEGRIARRHRFGSKSRRRRRQALEGRRLRATRGSRAGFQDSGSEPEDDVVAVAVRPTASAKTIESILEQPPGAQAGQQDDNTVTVPSARSPRATARTKRLPS